MDDKPTITCIVGYRMPTGEYVVRTGEPVTLETAANYARYGWEVILDPFDLEVFTRWEQMERAMRQPNWNKW